MELTSQRILKREFNRRLSVNPRYSKRAFARHLGLSASFLSHLWNGKRRLTPKVAGLLAEKLELDEEQKQLLLKECLRDENLPGEEHADVSLNEISSEVFSQISEWWIIGILEYIKGDTRDHSYARLSQEFGISVGSAQFAIETLIRFNLIKRDAVKKDRYHADPMSQVFGAQSPNQHLRKYHNQLLDRAKDALIEVEPERKVVSSLTLAFDPRDISEIERRYEAFLDSLESFIVQGEARSSVYSAVFEFLPLNRSQKDTAEHENE